jgi:hypothetical protein
LPIALKADAIDKFQAKKAYLQRLTIKWDQAEKLGDKIMKKKSKTVSVSVHLPPFQQKLIYSIRFILTFILSIKVLHFLRANFGPSSHQLRVPFSGDRFYGKVIPSLLEKRF